MQFWGAVVFGILVMIVFVLVTVNILDIIPLAGPFVGGVAAGYAGGKNYLSGGRAGIVSALAGAFIVSADVLLQTGFLAAVVPHTREIAFLLFFLVSLIYFPVLGFIGGAAGGILRSGTFSLAGPSA